jgi:ribose transport system ATP-binding protein
MMFGKLVQVGRPDGLAVDAAPVMEVRHLSRGTAFHDVGFTLRRGEVLGIAGLLGSGRTELLRGLFGADPPDTGVVVVQGKEVRPRSPLQMKNLGIAFAPEKRKEEGLIQMLSTRVNICLASLSRISSRGFTTRARERKVVWQRVRDVDILVADSEAPVSSLSGGNQQKVVLAKWLGTDPCVMLLDEPTRGIDLQSKQQIFEILWGLSRRGISSIVVSSELEELIGMCHRILVMKGGRIVGDVVPSKTSLEKLFALCID